MKIAWARMQTESEPEDGLVIFCITFINLTSQYFWCADLYFLWFWWQYCRHLSFAKKLHVKFHSSFYLVLMEMQISFHMACSMLLYPLGRGKKRQETEKWLAQKSWFCLLTHLYLHHRGQSPVQGGIQAQEPRAALSDPPYPEHDGFRHPG